ncbi:hypothetical protein EDD16DRAFT_1552768, partial [Pisolithus croceorrhizus]
MSSPILNQCCMDLLSTKLLLWQALFLSLLSIHSISGITRSLGTPCLLPLSSTLILLSLLLWTMLWGRPSRKIRIMKSYAMQFL